MYWFRVTLPKRAAKNNGHREIQSHQATHNHGNHSHEHAHDHSQGGVSTLHEHEHHRGLTEIRDIIGKASGITDKAKNNAIAMFKALGAAEAKIHNTDIERIHFHEVGAVDAIVDIVCAAVGAEALNVDQIVCSSLNVGSGTVKCQHGVFPVPAPATLELLKDVPIYSSGPGAEMVTPTGAAIVKILTSRFSSLPPMKVEQIGYGAGTRDFADHPNVLRIVIGETQDDFETDISHESTQVETVVVLEANLDDLNPQVFGYVMDRLLEDGALDAFYVPVQMKKNRPGVLLRVLCRPEEAGKFSSFIFAETSTLGIRRREEKRQVLTRKWESVSTQWGDVRIKIASMNGTITNYAPEYEDCRRIAKEKNVPLKTVINQALQAFLGQSSLTTK